MGILNRNYNYFKITTTRKTYKLKSPQRLMSSKILTPSLMGALDFQTNQLYEAFERAVSTREHQDAVWAGALTPTLYTSLSRAIDHLDFMDLSRNPERVTPLDGFFLHYAIAQKPIHSLERHIRAEKSGNPIESPANRITTEEVISAIEEGAPYSKIHTISGDLAAPGERFEQGVRVLRHVRKTIYPVHEGRTYDFS